MSAHPIGQTPPPGALPVAPAGAVPPPSVSGRSAVIPPINRFGRPIKVPRHDFGPAIRARLREEPNLGNAELAHEIGCEVWRVAYAKRTNRIRHLGALAHRAGLTEELLQRLVELRTESLRDEARR